MYKDSLLEEAEQKIKDRKILEEITANKKSLKRNFASVINNKKISRQELDELMYLN